MFRPLWKLNGITKNKIFLSWSMSSLLITCKYIVIDALAWSMAPEKSGDLTVAVNRLDDNGGKHEGDRRAEQDGGRKRDCGF